MFNENYDNFLLYLGFFRVQIGLVSKIKRSQLRLAPVFQKPLIEGQVLVSQFLSQLILNSYFPALVLFFTFSDIFFALDIFQCHTQMMEIISWIYRFRTSCESFEKKPFKKIKYSRSFSDHENYWCGHQQPNNFFPIAKYFRIIQEKQNQLIQSRQISCCSCGKKCLSIISKGKVFIADRKNSLCRSLLVNRSVSIPLCLQDYFGDHEDLYFSCSLFCFSFVIDNAKPTCLDYVNSNIYSCILLLLKLHGTI